MILAGALPAACLPCFLLGTTLSERRAVVCLSCAPGRARPALRVLRRTVCVRCAALRPDFLPGAEVFGGTVTIDNSPQTR